MKKIILKSFCARCLTLLVLALLSTNLAWGETWTRVTTIEELIDGGTFIMGYEANPKSGEIVPLRSADCNATTTANGYFHTGVTVEAISNSKTIKMASVTITEDYEIYITPSSTKGYINIQMKDTEGNYYGASSSGTSKNTGRLYTTGNTNETNIKPEYANETNNQFKLTSGVSGQYKYLKYNTSDPRFAFYSSTGSNIVFYKKGISTKKVSSIAVNTPPTKTTYKEGETFNPKGLVITATYDAGAPEDIAYESNENKFTFDPTLETALTTANNQVTITYGGKSTTQDINVEESTKYDVTVNSSGNGSASADVSEAWEGQLVTITATPNLGFRFSSWTVNEGGVELSSTTTNPATFTMGTLPVSITANFEQVSLQAIVAYNETDEKYWAMTTSISNNKAAAVEVEIVDGEVCVSNKVAESISWFISDKTSSTATISTIEGKYLNGTGDNTNISLSENEFEWSIDGTNETWRVSSGGRPLFEQSVNNKDTHVFGTYAASNINATQKSDNIEKNTRYSYYATAYPIKITSIEATITSEGFATFSSDCPLNLSNLPEGLTAYKATTAGNGKVHMVAVEGVVAENTGLFLKGEAGTTYTIPVAASGNALDDNILKATTGEALAEGDYVYVIASGAFQPLGQATVVSKGKAYIPKDAITTSGKLEISFGEPTGITSYENDNDNENIYNLNGVRVNGNYKGIVIMNGKKYNNK